MKFFKNIQLQWSLKQNPITLKKVLQSCRPKMEVLSQSLIYGDTLQRFPNTHGPQKYLPWLSRDIGVSLIPQKCQRSAHSL